MSVSDQRVSNTDTGHDCGWLLTTETVSKHKMKRKYRKFESAKTIPENPIVPCGPFYEVNFFDCTENGFFADVFTQSGP